jgi:hypothetical protein
MPCILQLPETELTCTTYAPSCQHRSVDAPKTSEHDSDINYCVGMICRGRDGVRFDSTAWGFADSDQLSAWSACFNRDQQLFVTAYLGLR